MRGYALLFAALALAGCNPFVATPKVPAPTLADPPSVEVPMGHTSVTKTYAEHYAEAEHPKADKLVTTPMPRVAVKKRPVVKKPEAPFETKLLPYSCATVRWAERTFGKAFLDSMGANLTEPQKAEVARCFR